MDDIRDPIVIDSPGFDPTAGWEECEKWVNDCGGLAHEDGEPNWRAAFGADPGCCSCPNCGEMYWRWGRVIECLDCHFRIETDWWAMYSWGTHEARRRAMDPLPPAYHDSYLCKRIDDRHAEYMKSAYYRYGFEHPCEDPWKEKDRIPWKEIFGGHADG